MGESERSHARTHAYMPCHTQLSPDSEKSKDLVSIDKSESDLGDKVARSTLAVRLSLRDSAC